MAFKKNNLILLLMVTLICIYIVSNSYANISKSSIHKGVVIKNMGSYFNVVIDLNSGKSHKEIGSLFGKAILKAVPDYEKLIDSYLKDMIVSNEIYMLFLSRAKSIENNMNRDYIDEIDGIASALSGSEDILGDGKLSRNEAMLLNLIPDVARETQCCALSIYKKRSATKSTITGRILDWYSGSENQLAKVQSVITFENGNKSICSIGYLGYMGIISGFSDNKVFAAILDSANSEKYSEVGKRSYPFDIRYALENCNNLDGVGNFMISKGRQYSFSHLIFLSDPKKSKVVENNVGSKEDSLRVLRDDQTVLNNGISWGIPDSIATVNSFQSKGNLDNHTMNLANTMRWGSFKNELSKKGDIVTLGELKEIMSYYTGDKPNKQVLGDLYNSDTQQIIVFEPKNCNLEVAFRPINNVLPSKPDFIRIPVKFN